MFWTAVHFNNTVIFNEYSNFKNYFISNNFLTLKIDNLKKDLIEKDFEIFKLRESLNISANSLGQSLKKILIVNELERNYFEIYESILLDKGFRDGVKKNDEVFIAPNYYLGKIGRIERESSLLFLAGGNGNKIEGVLKVNSQNINISSDQSLVVDLSSLGGTDFYFEIPKEFNLSIPSLIYLKSDETKIIGNIIKIVEVENSLYNKVYVQGFYNPNLNQQFYINIK